MRSLFAAGRPQRCFTWGSPRCSAAALGGLAPQPRLLQFKAAVCVYLCIYAPTYIRVYIEREIEREARRLDLDAPEAPPPPSRTDPGAGLCSAGLGAGLGAGGRQRARPAVRCGAAPPGRPLRNCGAAGGCEGAPGGCPGRGRGRLRGAERRSPRKGAAPPREGTAPGRGRCLKAPLSSDLQPRGAQSSAEGGSPPSAQLALFMYGANKGPHSRPRRLLPPAAEPGGIPRRTFDRCRARSLLEERGALLRGVHLQSRAPPASPALSLIHI